MIIVHGVRKRPEPFPGRLGFSRTDRAPFLSSIIGSFQMQLLGLIIILCLAMIYIWVRRMPSPHAKDFARPISDRNRRSMPARFDKRALAG